MADHDKAKTAETSTDGATKPANQDVGPPAERVDDETGGDERTTTRQE